MQESLTEKTEHTKGAEKVEQKATCEKDGLSYCECLTCGERVLEKIIPATGHTEVEWIMVEKPTCTKKRTKDFKMQNM